MTTLRAWVSGKDVKTPTGSPMALFVDLDAAADGKGYVVTIMRCHRMPSYTMAEHFAEDAAALMARLYGPMRELSHNGIIARDKIEEGDSK